MERIRSFFKSCRNKNSEVQISQEEWKIIKERRRIKWEAHNCDHLYHIYFTPLTEQFEEISKLAERAQRNREV